MALSAVGRHWPCQPWAGTDPVSRGQALALSAVGRHWPCQPWAGTGPVGRGQHWPCQPWAGTGPVSRGQALALSAVSRHWPCQPWAALALSARHWPCHPWAGTGPVIRGQAGGMIVQGTPNQGPGWRGGDPRKEPQAMRSGWVGGDSGGEGRCASEPRSRRSMPRGMASLMQLFLQTLRPATHCPCSQHHAVTAADPGSQHRAVTCRRPPGSQHRAVTAADPGSQHRAVTAAATAPPPRSRPAATHELPMRPLPLLQELPCGDNT